RRRRRRRRRNRRSPSSSPAKNNHPQTPRPTPAPGPASRSSQAIEPRPFPRFTGMDRYPNGGNMNSLFKLCGYGQRAVIALIIFSALGLVAAAQTVAPQSQGRHYGVPGFQGEPINLNVVNADIRDILNYITEQYGVNFVIDKSVKPSPITVNVSDVPWNVALDSILRSQELGVQHHGPRLRDADSQALASEGAIIRAQLDNQLDGSPLYTEFIRLNYARAAGAIGRGSA